ncbi:tumor protein p53-inducible protein 11 [Amazona aestiva]|uniref:Tumor protein p53-inducible protein 11 n=1 Tax=Amazona aestiva TaxID=12930 RepID=A0A0Q3LTG1_AMAAE|nr:tumor protein p53-inducible protein 11 [Amazona aestiva]
MAAKQPPPLMKKHSQTDLVSRLKTRKILGVGGEDDDGEVHRSKPGIALGIVNMRVGWMLLHLVLHGDDLHVVCGRRQFPIYVGISLIMWNALYTAEKVIIRWTLLTEACYFAVQFLVTTVSLVESSRIATGAVLLLVSRVLFILISIYYYYQVGRRPKKV